MTAPELMQWLGRCTTNEYTLAMTTTEQVIAPANPRRVAVCIIPASGATLYLSWGSAAVVNQGVKLTSALLPMVFNRLEHGGMPAGPIRGVLAGGASTTVVIETLAPPD